MWRRARGRSPWPPRGLPSLAMAAVRLAMAAAWPAAARAVAPPRTDLAARLPACRRRGRGGGWREGTGPSAAPSPSPAPRPRPRAAAPASALGLSRPWSWALCPCGTVLGSSQRSAGRLADFGLGELPEECRARRGSNGPAGEGMGGRRAAPWLCSPQLPPTPRGPSAATGPPCARSLWSAELGRLLRPTAAPSEGEGGRFGRALAALQLPAGRTPKREAARARRSRGGAATYGRVWRRGAAGLAGGGAAVQARRAPLGKRGKGGKRKGEEGRRVMGADPTVGLERFESSYRWKSHETPPKPPPLYKFEEEERGKERREEEEEKESPSWSSILPQPPLSKRRRNHRAERQPRPHGHREQRGHVPTPRRSTKGRPVPRPEGAGGDDGPRLPNSNRECPHRCPRGSADSGSHEEGRTPGSGNRSRARSRRRAGQGCGEAEADGHPSAQAPAARPRDRADRGEQRWPRPVPAARPRGPERAAVTRRRGCTPETRQGGRGGGAGERRGANPARQPRCPEEPRSGGALGDNRRRRPRTARSVPWGPKSGEGEPGSGPGGRRRRQGLRSGGGRRGREMGEGEATS
ncbi:hypothetical protein PVAP13_6NG348050 [Panicum virgatum]|uniref:Uncharacterized protein n=1 Tax=Panicum virgatum TaxID=38727 RepID=A0A8T0R468_PANVG|nr:hypothetical protein PVAP13_6NG348050 [Panicum virgatum]